jgi:tetratricopeptide (TPR) repeat protein
MVTVHAPRIPLRILAIAIALCAGVACAAKPAPAPATPATPAPTASTADADEAAQGAALDRAWARIQAGHSEQALPILDAVIAHYEARHPAGKVRWYVARDAAEAITYTALATMSIDRAAGETGAQVLVVHWADAWFLKGYALVELGRLDAAHAALGKAVGLSPNNATYLIEQAEVSKLERDWATASELYTRAEAAAEFSPPAQRRHDRGQALRGEAFVGVEIGHLDDARKILEECLKLDPNDARAKEDLAYIAKLQAQK